MKKIKFSHYAAIILCCIFMISCSDKSSKNKKVIDVDATTFKTLIQKENLLLIDVRTPEEVSRCAIANSINIDYNAPDFKEKINLLDLDRPVGVYCKSGGRSARAARALKDKGFTVYQLDGGIMGWQANRFPVIRDNSSSNKVNEELTLEQFSNIIATDTPVLVNFNTSWCVPCKKMLPILNNLEQEYKERIKVFRVNAEKSDKINEKYKVYGIPYFLLFDKGIIKWRHSGILSKEQLQTQIDNILD